MKVWCYDDAHHWGTSLAEAAKKRGHTAAMFDRTTQPDNGFVFVHMHAHPAVREHHKRLMQHFATLPRFKLVPTYREAMLYDDKMEQLRQLARYMPPTDLFRSPAQARSHIEAMPRLPIISKSSQGSGVRILRSYDDCRREVKQAFSDLGIKNRHGDRAHGYLYWQEYVGDHRHTMRVLIVGQQAVIARRGARGVEGQDQRVEPIAELDEEALSAVTYARRIADAEQFKFCGLDLIPDQKGGWYLLKLTVGWQVRKYFDAKFVPRHEPGTAFWDVVVQEMEAGHCG